VLLVIADLTGEKTRLLLKQKADARKDFLISAANEKLSEQFRHRERSEQALKAEKERFERLAGLLNLPVAVVASGGSFRYVSPDFKEFFGSVANEFQSAQKTSAAGQPLDPCADEILQWLAELGSSNEISQTVRTFMMKRKDGGERIVVCKAAKLENSEYLVICEDLTRNGRQQSSRLASPTL
jgi:PAS domain S-box-containing protein